MSELSDYIAVVWVTHTTLYLSSRRLLYQRVQLLSLFYLAFHQLDQHVFWLIFDCKMAQIGLNHKCIHAVRDVKLFNIK